MNLTFNKSLLIGLCLLGPLCGAAATAGNELAVADGLTVTLEYTLTLSDQSVVDTNVGQAPFSFTQGAHEIVPGLEKALVGMKAGETKRVQVAALDGYGPYDKAARTDVEKTRLPADVKVGDLLQGADGRIVKVLEVKDKTVVVDLNHPLAGKNLTFDVKVLNVEQPASSSEPKP